MQGADIEPARVVELSQLLQDPGVFGGQAAQGLDPGLCQADPASPVVIDMGVAAQAEGIDIEALDKGLPVADLDPVLRPPDDVVFDDGDVRRRPAHIDDQGIPGLREGAGPDHTGGRAAQQGLDGALGRKFLRHLGPVAADDRERDVQAHGIEDLADGGREGADDRDQAGVQEGPGPPADGIAVREEGVAQDDGHVPELLEAPDDLPGPKLIGAAVVGPVELDDADAVAVRQKVRDLPAEGLPVRLVRGRGIRQDPAFHQQDIRRVGKAVFPVGAHKDLGGDAEKDDLAVASPVFHTGIGRQGRGQGRLAAPAQQVRGKQAEDLGDPDLEVLVGGQGLGRSQHSLFFKIIDDGVRTGPARVDPKSQHKQPPRIENPRKGSRAPGRGFPAAPGGSTQGI